MFIHNTQYADDSFRNFVPSITICLWAQQVDGSVQDCSNSIANALELLQSCTKPSKSKSGGSFILLWDLCHEGQAMRCLWSQFPLCPLGTSQYNCTLCDTAWPLTSRDILEIWDDIIFQLIIKRECLRDDLPWHSQISWPKDHWRSQNVTILLRSHCNRYIGTR